MPVVVDAGDVVGPDHTSTAEYLVNTVGCLMSTVELLMKSEAGHHLFLMMRKKR